MKINFRIKKRLKGTTYEVIGGGSLIHKSVVITTAKEIHPYFASPNQVNINANNNVLKFEHYALLIIKVNM